MTQLFCVCVPGRAPGGNTRHSRVRCVSSCFSSLLVLDRKYFLKAPKTQFFFKAKKHVSPFFCILVVTFSTRFVQTPLSKNDDESRVDELEKTRDDDDATSFVRISCAPDGVLVDGYHSRGGDGGDY